MFDMHFKAEVLIIYTIVLQLHVFTIKTDNMPIRKYLVWRGTIVTVSCVAGHPVNSNIVKSDEMTQNVTTLAWTLG